MEVTHHLDIPASCRLLTLPPGVQDVEKAVFNDEAEVAAARKRQELIAQQERLREAYNELKYTAPDKVEAMRDQEMTRMKMSLAYRTGKSGPKTLAIMHSQLQQRLERLCTAKRLLFWHCMEFYLT